MTRISSPFDNYFQGKGTRPSDIDLGKTKTTPTEDEKIKRLMLPLDRVKRNKFDGSPKTIEPLNA